MLPSQLSAVSADGGVDLTWKDNSADEMHFMVMRMMHEGPTAGQMTELANLDENVAGYHDASIESGMTYMYKVSAMNERGESDSDEVILSVP